MALSNASGIPSTLQQVSDIAMEARRLQALTESPATKKWIHEAIEKAYESRNSLIQDIEAEGLIVSPVKYDGVEDTPQSVFEDLSAYDDAHKLIQAQVRVPVYTAEQAQRVYSIASKRNLAVMTSGAKTSALGVFQARQMADLRGYTGIICLECPVSWDENQGFIGYLGNDEKGIEKPKSRDLLTLPEDCEPVWHEKLPIAYYQLPNGSYRVAAHVGVTVNQVNAFLKEFLTDEQYRYQIMPDLTSKGEASIGGVVNTGAEGGNRASAKLDLLAIKIVNASGTTHLEAEDAKDIVGYNGLVGTCLQATFEVTAIPKHEFGFVIPVSGNNTDETWQNALKLQSLLAPYCVHPSELDPQHEDQQLLISSMEILGRPQVQQGFKNFGQSHAKEVESLLPILDGERRADCQMFVYVVGSTFHDLSDDDGMLGLLSEKIMTESFAMDEEEMLDGDFLALTESNEERSFSDVLVLMNEDILRVMDSIRHSAPEMARRAASQLGSQTLSTDFNIRFVSEDEDVNAENRAHVAKIYSEYIQTFESLPFRVDVYGHLYPGMVESPLGGGMDPHVRVTLKLNDPATRNNAPELVNMMKSERSKLYKKLLDLKRTCTGIDIAPPEKSHLTTKEYLDWLRLYDQEKIRHMEHVFLGDDPVNYSDRMRDAFRAPLELPNEPQCGVRSFFASDLIDPEADPKDMNTYSSAILHLAQLSHRSPKIKALLREVTASIRKKFDIDPYAQHVFFIESVEEGRDIIHRNLPGVSEEVSFQIGIDDFSSGLDEQSVGLLSSIDLGGIKGSAVMIVPHELIQAAQELQANGSNRSVHCNLVDMFLRYPYETPETPNIVAIASMGIALQIDDLDKQPSDKNDTESFITANPGPVQIHDSVKSAARREGLTVQLSPEEYDDIIKNFRQFLKVPDHISLGFTGSATQCMQLFAKSLRLHEEETQHHAFIQVTQVLNGAFSERFESILQSQGVAVHSYRTPWTTSENSQMPHLIDHFVREICQAKEQGDFPLIIVTPHKTSTSAHFHPNVLIYALKNRGFEIEKDYELLCDITSGMGVIDYFEGQDHQGLSFFGSVQKAMACPSGLAVFGLSPRMKRLLADETIETPVSLQASLQKVERGIIDNPFALFCLGKRVEAEVFQERNVADVEYETRKKMVTLLGFMLLHPGLSRQVTDFRDQSPAEMGLYYLGKNIPEAINMMDKVFNIVLGSGYGPFSTEAMRLYLPTISSDQLDTLLMAFDSVLKFPEVMHTVNKKAPLVSLREPHDILSTLKNLVVGLNERLEADDLIKYTLALEWVWRLKYTYERGRDTIYGTPENISSIEAILNTQLWPKDDGGSNPTPTLKGCYAKLKSHFSSLQNGLLYGNDVDLSVTDDFVKDIFKQLKEIVMILEKYALHAPRTVEGRVKWPLTATPEQLNGNGH